MIFNVNFKSDSYTIKREFLPPGVTYSLYNGNEKILTAHKKLFSLGNEINFKDTNNNNLMEISSTEKLERFKNYTIETNDLKSATLKQNFSMKFDQWQLKSPDGESVWAKISRKSVGKSWLRTLGRKTGGLPNFFEWIPRNYRIENQNADKIGEVDGHMGIRYSYEVDLKNVPRGRRMHLITSIIAILAVER
jgi:hypothetical protein